MTKHSKQSSAVPWQQVKGKTMTPTPGAETAVPTLEPDLSYPTATIEDPVLLHQAYRIDHVGINAFLVALAAWQRGLRVSFHYEVASKCERSAWLPIHGCRGELFSVSDGRRERFFRRTQSDLISRQLSARADNKEVTKQRLIEHGIDVPDGIVVSRQATSRVEGFLAKHAGKRFILKPLDGTLGGRVKHRLKPEAVLPLIQNSQESSLLLEEFVEGSFHCVYVVGYHYVGAYELRPASVEGDGQHSIAELVERKNRACRHRPLHKTKRLVIGETQLELLRALNLGVDSVLPEGRRVFLNDIPTGDEGADLRDTTDEVPLRARKMAVAACKALELPVASIDFIIGDDDRIVVLGANQYPLIAENVFPCQPPSPGNRVAEAIIDHHFPASRKNRRLTEASFDFMSVCQMLPSGIAGEIILPTLGPDWVHKRFSIAATRLNDQIRLGIRRIILTQGIHAQMIISETGDLTVDVVAPESRYQAFFNALEDVIR